jgi:hypothetical protein
LRLTARKANVYPIFFASNGLILDVQWPAQEHCQKYSRIFEGR